MISVGTLSHRTARTFFALTIAALIAVAFSATAGARRSDQRQRDTAREFVVVDEAGHQRISLSTTFER